MNLREIEEKMSHRLRNRHSSNSDGLDNAERAADIVNGSAKITIDVIEATNREALAALGHANFIITGRSGAGKSTLINTMFRKPLAEVGIGLPVTQETRCYEDPEMPLRIYDTKGLELGSDVQESVLEEIKRRVSNGLKSRDPEQRIDVIWYCVNAGTNRIEPKELEWIDELASLNGTGLVVVLTQCFRREAASQLRDVIQENLGKKAECVMVLAQKNREDKKSKAFGLRELLNATHELLNSNNKREAFISAQGCDHKLKENAARKCIPKYVLDAMIYSVAPRAIPLPGTNLVSGGALVLNEIAMCAKATAIYGIDLDKHFAMELFSIMIGVEVATVGGRTAANVAANAAVKAVADFALSWIPGEGVVTGAVNGVTAAAVTFAFGQTYVTLLTMIDKNELTEEDLHSDRAKGKIRGIFNKEYSRILHQWKKKGKKQAEEEISEIPEEESEDSENNAEKVSERNPKKALPNPFSSIRIKRKKDSESK